MTFIILTFCLYLQCEYVFLSSQTCKPGEDERTLAHVSDSKVL